MKKKVQSRRGVFLIIIFFVLGFAIAALLFYKPTTDFPSAHITAANAEIIPIVDRNYFDIVVPEIQQAERQIDIAMFQFKFYENEENKVRFFEPFRPIALAGISTLPDTVADRCMHIELKRKRVDDKVERLQTDRIKDRLQSIRDELHIFALERTPVILNLYNEFRDELIPECVDDRLRDGLEIMYSIAGGLFCYEKNHTWQIVLNEAAKALSGVRESEEDEIYFIRAVRILKEQFSEDWGNYKVLTSKDAVEIFSNGGLDWVTEPKHARSILRRLGIRSGPHRVNNKPTRGYRVERAKVDDLIKRYGEDNYVPAAS